MRPAGGHHRGVQLPEEIVDRLLAGWPVARLGTVGGDGAPHLVPVVFARAGGVLWSPIDGKPKPAREPVRLRNVRRTGRATLLLDRYDDDWRTLWWIRVDATAQVVTVADAGADPATAAADALRHKYPQYARVPLFHQTPTLIRLEPQAIASWCAGPAALAATGYG